MPAQVDENADVAMYESDDICQYLRETYGPAQDAYDPKALWPLTFGPFQLITSTLAAVIRGLPGGQRRADARAGNEERKPLELWGYETSPFVRPVRETLCALTLPHVMVPSCVEIKLSRRISATAESWSSRHRRDASSTAWRCGSLATRFSQHGRVVAEK